MKKPIAGMILFAVLAGTTTLAHGAGRYTMERTENGFVRLDHDTGEISNCVQQGEKWVCRISPDERTALLDEIARLQERVGDLENRVGALESGKPPVSGDELPSQEEFDQTLGFMEQFMRRFMGIIEEFESEENAPPAAGQPEKT